MQIEPIAYFHSPFATKFGVPKQSGLVENLQGIIEFVPKYRNADARHTYETETKKNMTNLKTVDNFLQSKKKLTNPTMIGANNNQVNGQSTNSKLFSSVVLQTYL